MKKVNLSGVAVILLLVGALTSSMVTDAVAQQGSPAPGEGQRPPDANLFGGTTFDGGYLKYSYKVSQEGVDEFSVSTTEITPQEDGTYRIENSSTAIVPEGLVSIALYGINLRGLGFRIPSETGGTVDLSPLEAVESETLAPNKEYILPDGAFLVVGKEGAIAGLDVIYATYTHADFKNVQIQLAMPVDIEIRNMLPIFPYIELEYVSDELPEEGVQEDHQRMRSFSKIELIEFIYER